MTKREHTCFLEYRFETPAHLADSFSCCLEHANSKFDELVVDNAGISFVYAGGA